MSKIPTRARELVTIRSLASCERCGGRGTEVHHRKRGHPRLHHVSNLTRLCGACHHWATVEPQKAAQTGWVLQGQIDAERASAAPLALLGRIWVTLTPTGTYLLGGLGVYEVGKINGVRKVIRQLDVWTGKRQPVLGSVGESPSEQGAPGQSGAFGEFVHPPRHASVPAFLAYQLGETCDDFLARLPQELQALRGIGEQVEPCDDRSQ